MKKLLVIAVTIAGSSLLTPQLHAQGAPLVAAAEANRPSEVLRIDPEIQQEAAVSNATGSATFTGDYQEAKF